MEAHPGRNLPGLRPSPNTPSDVSCSSGPCSVVSTRETSPASSTNYSLEATSAARDLFISCPDHAAAAAEIPSPGPDLSRPRLVRSRPRPGLNAEIPSLLEMNPNPFQPVNDRRGKLAVDNPRASHTPSSTTVLNTPIRQSLAPVAPPHPSSVLPPLSTIHRGLSITNWRSPATSLDGLIAPSPTTSSAGTPCASRDNHVRTLATASSSSLLCSPPAKVDSRNNSGLLGHNSFVSVAGLSSSRPSSVYNHNIRHFDYQNSDSNTAKMHPQTGKIIADANMDEAMSYCYDRGGGQYTRLVPVDILPVDLQDIPRRVNTDEGMIVLPVPRQPGPDGQLANIQLDHQPVLTPPSSPNGVETDHIQSRIDSIVNSSPGPAGSGALVLSTRGFDGTTPTRPLQHHGASGGGSSGRREKIYCDKWIHDGTCAFTQQGCKYKHEMPHDRDTQEKLGLFHGYPTWWKKQAIDQQRPLAIDDRPVSLGAGRSGFGGLTSSTSMGGGLSSAVISSNWRAGPGHVGDANVQGSPTSPSPAAGGSGSMLGRGGSAGFGGSGRSNVRQPRTFASFQPAAYGPIAPPSRAGGSGSLSGSGSFSGITATRSTRALTASSAASNGNGDDDEDDDGGHRGGGAPYNHRGPQPLSAFDSGNPFAPLGDHSQSARATRVRRDASSSGDTIFDGDEEQRGALL